MGVRTAHHKSGPAPFDADPSADPAHAIARLVPPAEYWLSRPPTTPSFGMSSGWRVECLCGAVIASSDFDAHLRHAQAPSRHRPRFTIHGPHPRYVCACGRMFRTGRDLADHCESARSEQLRDLADSMTRLNATLAEAMRTITTPTEKETA